MCFSHFLIATQQTRNIEPMLVQCWFNVEPTLVQRLVFSGLWLQKWILICLVQETTCLSQPVVANILQTFFEGSYLISVVCAI